MKTAELSGATLDWWVAKAEGVDVYREYDTGEVWHGNRTYRPSTDWDIAGPIIEREKISTVFEPWLDHPKEWQAVLDFAGDESGGYNGKFIQYGQTALIAAMRAFVASKFGEEVPDIEQPGA